MSDRSLHRIFSPKSIALWGVGDKEASLTGKVLHHIISGGYKGRVFSLSRGTDPAGVYLCSDLEEIESSVDLGILSAPPGNLIKAVGSFAKIKPAGLIIISQADFTPDQKQELIQCARSAGIRLIGPYSWGFVNPMLGLNAGLSNQAAFSGDLAVISQSSAICATLLELSATKKIGMGLLIGLGDTIDIDFADVIDYLTHNSRISAILLHVESLKNLRHFMSAARAAARVKPIIALKTDRHGNPPAPLQTGSMNRIHEMAMYDAAFKRAGIIRVETVEALFDSAELISKTTSPKGPSLLIISDSKIPGTMAVDALYDSGISPVHLQNDTIKNIDRILPAGWSRCNPICTRAELTPEIFEKLILCCLNEAGINGLLIILSPQFIADPEAFATYLTKTVSQIRIPVLVAWMGGDRVSRARRILNEAGISTSETPERAVNAFVCLYHYELNQKLLQEIPSGDAEMTIDVSSARSILEMAAGKKSSELSHSESTEILNSYGLPAAPAHLTRHEQQGLLKPPGGAHRQHAPGINLFMGARMTRDFGPVIFMAPGNGISNIFHDRAIGLPPLNHTLARHMMRSSSILMQFLQANACDTEHDLSLCEDLIIRLSNLVADFPKISSIDMNVLLAPKKNALITEPKITIAQSSIPPPLHLIISPYPNHYEITVTTKYGLGLFLRPIKPEDAKLLQTLWYTFSEKTLYYRFARHIGELTPKLLVSLTQIDYDREIAVVAIHHAENGDRMLGVGRLYGEIGAKISEFSVVVGDPWQGLGIGAQLLSHLIFIAKNRRMKTIWGLIQRENKNMIELARHLNFSVKGDPGDPQVEAILKIVY